MKVGGIMKKTNKLPYKKVRVIWVDIQTSSQWYEDLTDVDNFSYSWCEDVGYLYSKDNKVIKIFASHSFDDNGKLSLGNITAYPRCVVKKLIYEK